MSTDNVGLHLKNIFEDGELTKEATTEESSLVQIEGSREVRRPVAEEQPNLKVPPISAQFALEAHKNGQIGTQSSIMRGGGLPILRKLAWFPGEIGGLLPMIGGGMPILRGWRGFRAESAGCCR